MEQRGMRKNFWRRELRIKTMNLSSDRKREGAAESVLSQRKCKGRDLIPKKAQHIGGNKSASMWLRHRT